jgi:transposase InsO family protein
MPKELAIGGPEPLGIQCLGDLLIGRSLGIQLTEALLNPLPIAVLAVAGAGARHQVLGTRPGLPVDLDPHLAALPFLIENDFLDHQPRIWNSDQGSQFTSAEFLAPLKERSIAISMDGRGRALDNVFIERLWRSLKYELIYPGDFQSGIALLAALTNYFHFYNYQRPHQALDYQTPADLFPHKHKRKKSLF